MSNLDKTKTLLLSLQKISETTLIEYSPKNQDILRLALNESISVIIEMISIIQDLESQDFSEERNKLEELINTLQEKIISQDETFHKMSKIFETLHKLTSFSSCPNSIRSRSD